ncbi:MAG: hypothetical protein ACREK1_08465, partial [Longimicrobiales bacterium]
VDSQRGAALLTGLRPPLFAAASHNHPMQRAANFMSPRPGGNLIGLHVSTNSLLSLSYTQSYESKELCRPAGALPWADARFLRRRREMADLVDQP